MFKALLIKALLQLGSNLLLSFAKSIVETLKARQDNDLDIGAETVKVILEKVKVVGK